MDSMIIYAENLEDLEPYDADTQAELIGWMAVYALTGREPDFPPDSPARYVWPTLKRKADRSREVYETKSAAGKRGGRPSKADSNQTESTEKADEKQTESTEKADGKQTESTAKAEGKPVSVSVSVTESESESAKRERKRAREGGALLSPGWFDRFWEAYPRKVSKEDARKAFTRAHIDGETLERDVLPGLEAWKRCRQWQDAEYVPYPATWLNQRRWRERPEPAAEKPRTVTAQQYSQRSYADEGGDDVREYMQRHGIDLRVAQA